MPVARAELTTRLPPDQAFARVTDWQRHAVPFTRIRLTDTGFVARTAVGPLGFDDPMDVVQLSAPTFCRIEKRGRVMRGWAEIAVEPHGEGSIVRWTEQIAVRGIGRWADPAVRIAATAMVRTLLRRTIAS